MKISDPQNMDGVIPAMITSFNKDESLNKEGIRKTVNYLISQKVNGLYITGSTGETFLMSPEEKKRVIEIIVEELLHPELPQYFSDVWQVFLQDFVDK